MCYSWLVRPLLFSLNPEFVHHETVRIGRTLSRSPRLCRIVSRLCSRNHPALETRLWGLTFRSPVGLAAGFDKQGEMIRLLSALGFGHLEVGSVSLRPWPGNPPPTMLRLPRDRGLINRMGLNSEGAEAVLSRLRGRRFETVTGVNLVKTADPTVAGDEAVRDFLGSFRIFHPVADFITLNLSCPNTSDGRTFEDPALLEPLLEGLNRLRQTGEGGRGGPVLVKLSPDLERGTLMEIVRLSEAHSIDGFVIGNTTVRRKGLKTALEVLDRFGPGGLSGQPLKRHILPMIECVAAATDRRLPIIACGGIGCDPLSDPAEEVWEYLKAGAALVQIYTGLIYRGPGLVERINRGLVKVLKREGLSRLAEVTGNR